MKSILDPSFQYTASFNTDIQKTFARIRRDRQTVAYRPSPAIYGCTRQDFERRQKNGNASVTNRD